MTSRTLSSLDRALVEIERALETVFVATPAAAQPSPAGAAQDGELDAAARRHAAGLMRVNHVGEVCAQALYFGQAAVARDEALRTQMLAAAAEETDHLAWCGERLEELDSRPSLLNPLWYAGAYAIGAFAGLVGDRLSLGFVVETERQVEAHLGEHLETLPPGDERSRAIVRRMKDDEAAHAERALAAGARRLPDPVPALMRFASKVMKTVAYRL
ncbi:2-polyprenyl-3-methyl-6-methoxy-1,4-benzoquinone monooxygenase [Dokdonella sp.]|uniref:2-polyprenyl-3-methyl-6-methoxy-1,4-benzoquinone monooxygenase n=1 Tax=Dokdonella sp. TaxID=2291710 RepID=UPI001B146E2C|nr:2-polyprenyl-3-methyl-6-methoxy-1,4-benzoquinone monooxygenase [Dokdonella sp.]MBO9664433.1 2-polyprenyl-3-methyl-6-methoxy-1,4-benzoquinone monooxygenase [Dokdonella sp.]